MKKKATKREVKTEHGGKHMQNKSTGEEMSDAQANTDITSNSKTHNK